MVSLGQNIAEYLGRNYLFDHVNGCAQGCNWVQLVTIVCCLPLLQEETTPVAKLS